MWRSPPRGRRPAGSPPNPTCPTTAAACPARPSRPAPSRPSRSCAAPGRCAWCTWPTRCRTPSASRPAAGQWPPTATSRCTTTSAGWPSPAPACGRTWSPVPAGSGGGSNIATAPPPWAPTPRPSSSAPRPLRAGTPCPCPSPPPTRPRAIRPRSTSHLPTRRSRGRTGPPPRWSCPHRCRRPTPIAPRPRPLRARTTTSRENAMKRKFMMSASTIAVAALVLSACGDTGGDGDTPGDGGSDNAGGSETTTITFAGWSLATTPEFQVLADGFEAANDDVKVEIVEYADGDDYDTQMITDLAAGTAPDVYPLKNLNHFRSEERRVGKEARERRHVD